MNIILQIILCFFLLSQTYGKNFYSVSTNPQKHIFILKIEIIDKKKLNISNELCFKCYKKKSKINLINGFNKINCSNVKFDGENYSAVCNKEIVGLAAPYRKQIQGDFKEAKLEGFNQLETIPANNFGTASFTLLNENEYILYKNYIKDNYFITTKEYIENFKNDINLEDNIDAELKQLREEKKRLEELKKIKEEKKKLDELKKIEELKELEEEKRRLDELKKIKEERKKLEEERKKIEALKKLEEEKRKLEKEIEKLKEE